jgi:hypothetical protein
MDVPEKRVEPMKGAAGDLVELARAFSAIVEAIAGRAAEGDGAAEPGWLDQHHSDLTVRQHCQAVRRRRAEGKPGASVKGRRYLLTREALWEEMTSVAKPGLRKCGTARPDTRNGGPATPPPGRHATVAEATAEKLRRIRGK